MTKLSKLWEMAFNYYTDSQYWLNKNVDKDYLTDMEDTLIYWWTRASCDELKACYNHLQQKIKARKRLPKKLNGN